MAWILSDNKKSWSTAGLSDTLPRTWFFSKTYVCTILFLQPVFSLGLYLESYRLLSPFNTALPHSFHLVNTACPSASQYFGTSLPVHLQSAPSLLAPASILLPLVTSITTSQFRPATFLAQTRHSSTPHKICQLTTLPGIESKVSHMLSKYFTISNTLLVLKPFLLFVVLWTPGQL